MNATKRRLTALLIALAMPTALAFSQTAAQKTKGAEQRASQPTAEDLNIRAYMELLRSDLRSKAATIVGDMMRLDDDEAEKFWPIYREYELALTKEGDRKLALIKQYSDNYNSMSDEVADQLVRQMFELEQARSDLKKLYYERFKQALSATTAARFVQVNNQILMLLDLQIASSLPVIQ